MRQFHLLALGAAVALVALAGAARAEGDPEKGAKVFNKCKACHEIKEAKNKVGPHLVGIVGRKAGSAEGFNYSDALKKAHDEGLVWNEETLAKYLADPKAFLPGNRMAFAGLKKEDEIEDLIAYLKKEASGS
ncbi:Cytochrome c-554 [bacterium HR40]|nr:Cytochrome c-554 [bacterium HR40]